MKRFCVFAVIFLFSYSFTVSAENIQNDLSEQLGLENAKELVPDYLYNDEIDFSPTKTPTENGLSVNAIFKSLVNYVFDAIGEEIFFVFLIIGIFIVSAVIYTFIDSHHPTLLSGVRFAVSSIIGILLLNHVQGAFVRASEYIGEITTFMTGLLPFFGSLSLVGGEISTAAVQKAILFAVINILNTFITTVVLPVCKAVVSLSVAGYISGVALGALSDFISNIATKTITICCGIMCAILYFQNTVTTVTDSFALRSVKLAAGSFIPIVGSFVSEASGTLISGVHLLKSTFGVFAICVLIYMSAQPIINFLIVKLSLRFSGIIAKLLGCDKESKVFGEISAVYNILSAIMIASTCFFIFAVAVFIKSEVK